MTYSGCTDEELVARSRGGDEDATDFLMEKYKPLVLKLSTARFLAGGDREDLIQEGMIGLYKAVRDFDPEKEASFYTFAGLCINRQMLHAIEASQRDKHRALNTSVELTDLETDWQETLEDLRSDPESVVLTQEETDERMHRIETELSPMEKKVVILLMRGKSYAEIAETLGKPQKSIYNAFQRIRQKMRRK